MRFNCGKSNEAKIREAVEKADKILAEIHAGDYWLPKFAWLPLRAKENDCRWLEWYWYRPEGCYASQVSPGQIRVYGCLERKFQGEENN